MPSKYLISIAHSNLILSPINLLNHISFAFKPTMNSNSQLFTHLAPFYSNNSLSRSKVLFHLLLRNSHYLKMLLPKYLAGLLKCCLKVAN